MSSILDKLSRGQCFLVDRDPDIEVSVQEIANTLSDIKTVDEIKTKAKAKPKAKVKEEKVDTIVGFRTIREDETPVLSIRLIAETKPPRKVVIDYLRQRLEKIKAREEVSDDEDDD